MARYSRQFKQEIERRMSVNERKASEKKAGPLQALQALGRLKAGQMNKVENAFADYLDDLKKSGELSWWAFECIKLRLADNTHYTVDFMVMRSTGELEAYEVKGGYAFDDSLVKLKVANDKFPWPFYLVKKAKGGGFDIKKVGNKE